MEERKEVIEKAHPGDFLLPEEHTLMHQFMSLQDKGFVWTNQQRGHFREDFFPPVEIPTIPHKPWVQCNIPILPGIYEEVCKVIKRKLDAGVYEPSNSSYRSRWFCVVKKDGKTLRIVHSLKPLNKVTIKHTGVTPFTDQIREHFVGRACRGMLNLYIGYDKHGLSEASRDLTTFQLPFGTLQLLTLPMGWTNSVPSSTTTSLTSYSQKFWMSPSRILTTCPYTARRSGTSFRMVQKNAYPTTLASDTSFGSISRTSTALSNASSTAAEPLADSSPPSAQKKS